MSTESRTPENTDTTYHYFVGSSGVEEIPMQNLIDSANNYFGTEYRAEDYKIGIEHFHARCVTYDQYASGDWDYYFKIEVIK